RALRSWSDRISQYWVVCSATAVALSGAVLVRDRRRERCDTEPIPQAEIVQRQFRLLADFRDESCKKSMSSIPDPVTSQILSAAPAANADRLSELPRPADAHL